jgi:hypothetical protein
MDDQREKGETTKVALSGESGWLATKGVLVEGVA